MRRTEDNRARLRLLTAATLLLLGLPRPGEGSVRLQDAQPAPPPPSILGQLFDSTRATPLGGARIILWNTPHETYSAGDGTFAFSGLETGDYSLVYFHPRLTVLGLSSGAHAVRVHAEGPAELFLATPSMLSIQATLCTMDRGGVGEGELVRVAGRVLDSETGFPLSGVPVEASWSGRSERTPLAERAFTDSEGWYRLCGVPPGTTVGVRAESASGSTLRREFRGVAGSLVRLDLPLQMRIPAVVQGLVLSLAPDGTRAPLEGSTAYLQGTRFASFTDASGRFRFADLPPGDYTLVVERPGYARRTDRLLVEGNTEVRVEAVLTEQAIELPELVVTVQSEMERRALSMGGRLITRDDFARALDRSRDVADLLRSQQVPGLTVRRQADGARSCVEFGPGATRLFRSTCESVQVYVDNVRSVDPQGAIEIPAEVVDRMILFRPVEAGVFGLGAGSGVLLIFTKSGVRR